MKFVWCWDDDQGTDIWFNLYVCEYCGMIRQDPGLSIDIFGNVYTYNKHYKKFKKVY